LHVPAALHYDLPIKPPKIIFGTIQEVSPMQQARIELLQRMPIFGGIRADILQFVLDLCPAVSVPANEYFFHEHDQADSMFVLEAGKVAILKSWRGQEYLLKILRAGNCFGEMAVMDLSPRSASVRAIEDCTAIRISAATLYKLYEQDLKQFALVQMNMGREVTRRLREADDRLFEKMGPHANITQFSCPSGGARG
jgi:CRP/FNR family cyclic AMP-dependent transcriptional regulator